MSMNEHDSSQTTPAVARRRSRGAARRDAIDADRRRRDPPAVARRGHRDRAVAAVVCRPGCCARRRARWHARRSCRRIGHCRVVAVFQPRAVVRARGRHPPDDRRGGRDEAPRPRVDREGRDGDAALHLVDPLPEPRPRRMGSGHPSPLGRSSARVVGRGHRARVRTVDAHTDSWHRWRRFGVPLAVDADSRATLLAQAATSPRPLPPSTPPAETPKEPLAAKTDDKPAALPNAAAAATPTTPAHEPAGDGREPGLP